MATRSSISNRDPLGGKYLVIAASLVIQFCLGALYAWPVYTYELTKSGWLKFESQTVFAVSLFTFSLFMIISRHLIVPNKIRPLTLTGGVLLGTGYILSGLSGGTSFWALLLGIGIVAGAGTGIIYMIPMTVAIRTFPERKGLVVGLSIAGFGFGGMVWIKMGSDWFDLIAHHGLSFTFILYGILFLLFISLASFFMSFPEEALGKSDNSKSVDTNLNTNGLQLLGTPQFYYIFFSLIACSASGLMFIGLMFQYPIESLIHNGLEEAEAIRISGTAIGIFFSIANGLGRIAWGVVSDRIGRRLSIVLVLITQGILIMGFTFMAEKSWSLYLGTSLIGFYFGALFALFPAITADVFGSAHISEYYPLIFFAYGIGGLVGPITGGILGDLSQFKLAYSLFGFLCIISTVFLLLLKPASKPYPVQSQGKMQLQI